MVHVLMVISISIEHVHHVDLNLHVPHVRHPLGDETSKDYNYLNLITLLERIITSWCAGHYTNW